MSGGRPALTAVLCGSAVALALWAFDLASLGGLSFAGLSDPRAQRRLLEVAGPAIASLEARLFALHAAVGGALGFLARAALDGLEAATRRRPRRPHVAIAAIVLTCHVAALLGMVGTYPQLYADRWWMRGGPRAALQWTVTHLAGPRPFDVLLLGLLLLLGMGAAVRGAVVLRGRGPGWASRLAAAAGALALAGITLGRPSGSAHAGNGAAPPNLLILASDSLRSDRIESAAVMPFTSSLVSQGSLYRFAFTPLARTFPSWVSALTGEEPRRHRVRTMFPSVGTLRQVGPTFFTELRDQGYHTFVVSDFAGDIFPRFNGGFDVVDAPTLTVDHLARATVLSAHTWSLPLLRLPALRRMLPEWRNLASLSDPQWIVDASLRQVRAARGRPFAGLVFFGTAHFPYVAPFPDYRAGSGGYRGRYLYHAPPGAGDAPLSSADVEQVRARYDGALRSIDRATQRLHRELRGSGLLESTVLVVTSDHGEDLYEEPGMAGHGDALGAFRAQYVPILLLGPGVPPGRASNAQVRLHDLGATVLELLGRPGKDRRFGDGLSLLAQGQARPVCVETGIWFWPTLPQGLRGQRLEYEGISELLEVDAETRQMSLRPEREPLVETAKERGVVLGRRFWRQRPTPGGPRRETGVIPGVEPGHEGADLQALFGERCVDGDPDLSWLYEAVVFDPPAVGEAAR